MIIRIIGGTMGGVLCRGIGTKELHLCCHRLNSFSAWTDGKEFSKRCCRRQ